MANIESYDYVLTFRCVNCGRYEASAIHPSEHALGDDQLKMGIYHALCKGCGWSGEVCGVSAVQTYRRSENKAKAVGR